MSNIFSLCPAEIRWERSPEPTTRAKGAGTTVPGPLFYGDKGDVPYSAAAVSAAVVSVPVTSLVPAVVLP